MTLSKLIKVLQKMEREGAGRSPVGVDKTTLWDGNGTFEVCDVVKVQFMVLDVADDDGFAKYTKRGHGITKGTVVLKGHNHD